MGGESGTVTAERRSQTIETINVGGRVSAAISL